MPPAMKPQQKKWIFWGCLVTPILAPLTLICLRGLNVFHAHEHCIKQARLGLRTYAMEHDGRCVPCGRHRARSGHVDG